MRRKITSVILAAVLAAGLLAGCGGSGSGQPAGGQTQEEAAGEEAAGEEAAGEEAAGEEQETQEAEEQETQSAMLGDLSDSGREGMTEEAPDAAPTAGTENPDEGSSAVPAQASADQADTSAGTETADVASTTEAVAAEPAGSASEPGEIPVGKTLEGAKYILIYDPLIYDQTDPLQLKGVTSLETGDISDQIVTGMDRADDMEIPDMPKMLSQDEINGEVDMDEIDREGSKGIDLAPFYSKGDQAEFNCFAADQSMASRSKETFECMYEGDRCYIWSWKGSISEEQALELGQEFDQNIYDKDVSTFGPARFMEDGGKLNILMYPMQRGLGGFFYFYDLVAEGEVSEREAQIRLPNYNQAIINVNSDMMTENMPFVKSTLAHEFQHLICASEYYYYKDTPMMKTWLNEAMSAYAEEVVYPGIKEENNYHIAMYLSDAFRKGQSLYNFSTTNDEYIGAYGAVYLFSQYLSQRAGDDVFYKVHEYWRSISESSVSEAGALQKSVPEDMAREIDETWDYPEQISSSFSSPEEEWMSKLTLAFHIETLSGKLSNLEEYMDAIREVTRYSEINPQLIQGGGRILVKMGKDTFTVPESADSGLIYVGLDENYQPIPGLIIVGE